MADGVKLVGLSAGCYASEADGVEAACSDYPRVSFGASGEPIHDTCDGGFGSVQWIRYVSGTDTGFHSVSYYVEPCVRDASEVGFVFTPGLYVALGVLGLGWILFGRSRPA